MAGSAKHFPNQKGQTLDDFVGFFPPFPGGGKTFRLPFTCLYPPPPFFHKRGGGG